MNPKTGWAALVLAMASLPVLAQGGAPVAVTDFAAGPGNGAYAFASSTPRTVVDLIDRQRPRPPQQAVGHLLLPADAPADAKLPAVVLVHGSGGVYREQFDFWARRFNQQGWAVFVLDVFGPRGAQATADDQSQVPFGADTADAFAALGLLASHPRLDGRRIAVMGFSRGGIAAWRTAATRLIEGSAPAGLRFAAHVPVYSGGCAGMLAFTVRPGVFGKAPMLWVHGDADDYTPLSACRDYAQRIGDAGTPVTFVTLPGARHKFDLDDVKRVQLRQAQRTREDCPLEFDLTGYVLRDRRSGEALAADKAQALNREACTAVGATVEGDPAARERAAQAVVEFLGAVFKGS